MATSHSWVMVPIICASMSPSMYHPGIPRLRRKFGEEEFGGAVSEVRAAMAHLSRPVRVTQLGLDPYIDAADQDEVIEKVFLLFGVDGYVQRITDVVMQEVAQHPLPHQGRRPTGVAAGVQLGEDRHHPSTASVVSQFANRSHCCDAPGDRTCKATGKPHNPPVCAVCHMVMKKEQPYCSKQDGERCAPQVGFTPPSSAFKEFEGCPFGKDYDYEGLPTPKAMKFTDKAEKDPE